MNLDNLSSGQYELLLGPFTPTAGRIFMIHPSWWKKQQAQYGLKYLYEVCAKLNNQKNQHAVRKCKHLKI